MLVVPSGVLVLTRATGADAARARGAPGGPTHRGQRERVASGRAGAPRPGVKAGRTIAGSAPCAVDIPRWWPSRDPAAAASHPGDQGAEAPQRGRLVSPGEVRTAAPAGQSAVRGR